VGSVTEVLRVAEEQDARGLSYSGALADLAILLSRLAIQQRIPGALDPAEPMADAIAELAGMMHPDLVQLFYSVAVHSRNELSLAPDEYAGFVMACLRMLALAPKASVDSGDSGGEPSGGDSAEAKPRRAEPAGPTVSAGATAADVTRQAAQEPSGASDGAPLSGSASASVPAPKAAPSPSESIGGPAPALQAASVPAPLPAPAASPAAPGHVSPPLTSPAPIEATAETAPLSGAPTKQNPEPVAARPIAPDQAGQAGQAGQARSEERRVGKGGRW